MTTASTTLARPSPLQRAGHAPRVRAALVAGTSTTPRPLLAAAVAATVMLWGSAFVGIRATLPALGYANVASGRLLLAAATFAMLSRRIGVRRPTKSQLPLLAALGATGYAGYQLLLSAGEQTVSAGTSALLFAGAPVLAALLARPILHERLSARSWCGLAVAVAGVAVVAGTQGVSGEGLGGAPLVLAAVALYALWVVLQKRALATMSAVDVTAWATWLGAGFALPFASGLPHAVTTAPAGALASLLLLGIIVTTVPFLLWTWTLARVEATSAAPFLLLVSPAALLIAWLWLGEAPALAAVAGGALTLVGVAAVQIGSRTEARRRCR
jgi:drug/metabolite transporter (DMT)-like permease